MSGQIAKQDAWSYADDELTDANSMLGKGYELEAPVTEIFGALTGYTPTPDTLCKKYGYVTALVWGRMWRYCQGRDGVCRAKIETISVGLGMSVRTVIRHIETLIEGGYFEDKTPNLKNRPHVYADTRKLRLAFSTEIIECGVTESHSTMTESHTHYDRESHEDSINKREVKKPLSAASKKKIIDSANKQVDGILLAEKQSTSKSWTNLPANYHEYGKAFCEATGLSYHKKDLYGWIETFDRWITDGYQPISIIRAVEKCREKSTDISAPRSITWALNAIKSAVPLAVSPALPNLTGAIDPNESKYVPNPNPRRNLTRNTTAG